MVTVAGFFGVFESVAQIENRILVRSCLLVVEGTRQFPD
jgi:hypothetical protein